MNIKKKTITVRFYEELNDFLSPERRKKRFVYEYIDRTSVKDLIESMGVPHTETDMILVNGKSVSFKYLIRDGDDISVYPVFESLDIFGVQHLRPKPLRRPGFICDVHLGKLSRYLRMLGFDVYYKNDLTEEKIIALSMSERRAVLTRNAGILKNGKITRGCFIRSSDLGQQVVEILSRFQPWNNIKTFSRCLECGGRLSRISKDSARGRVPEKVFLHQSVFCFCKNCNKIYWRGSHYNRMKLTIDSIMKLNL